MEITEKNKEDEKNWKVTMANEEKPKHSIFNYFWRWIKHYKHSNDWLSYSSKELITEDEFNEVQKEINDYWGIKL